MQDRPTMDELLAAVEGFLEQEIFPHVEDARQFHTRVALGALGMLRRELALDEAHLAAELAGLDAVLGGPSISPEPASSASDRRRIVTERTEALCERIRRGDADGDPFRAAALAHIRATVRAKLEVSNPRWLASASPPYPIGARSR
jgi:hypothetical protein